MRVRRRIVSGETCMDVSVDGDLIGLIPDLVCEARRIVEDKIAGDPEFGTSLSPLRADGSDHRLIVRMCQTAELAGVGPMASVAGAVASYVIEGLIAQGCGYAVIDNGGDLAIFSDEEVTVGLYTGRPSTSRFGLRVPRTDGIMGICSSSGVIGPSLSFGRSDIATVISRDPVLSDACATRLGNGIAAEGDLAVATEAVCGIPGVIGCFAAIGEAVCTCGDVPEVVIVGVRRPPSRTLPEHGFPTPQAGLYAGYKCGYPCRNAAIIRNAYMGYHYRHI